MNRHAHRQTPLKQCLRRQHGWRAQPYSTDNNTINVASKLEALCGICIGYMRVAVDRLCETVRFLSALNMLSSSAWTVVRKRVRDYRHQAFVVRPTGNQFLSEEHIAPDWKQRFIADTAGWQIALNNKTSEQQLFRFNYRYPCEWYAHTQRLFCDSGWIWIVSLHSTINNLFFHRPHAFRANDDMNEAHHTSTLKAFKICM